MQSDKALHERVRELEAERDELRAKVQEYEGGSTVTEVVCDRSVNGFKLIADQEDGFRDSRMWVRDGSPDTPAYRTNDWNGTIARLATLGKGRGMRECSIKELCFEAANGGLQFSAHNTFIDEAEPDEVIAFAVNLLAIARFEKDRQEGGA